MGVHVPMEEDCFKRLFIPWHVPKVSNVAYFWKNKIGNFTFRRKQEHRSGICNKQLQSFFSLRRVLNFGLEATVSRFQSWQCKQKVFFVDNPESDVNNKSFNIKLKMCWMLNVCSCSNCHDARVIAHSWSCSNKYLNSSFSIFTSFL